MVKKTDEKLEKVPKIVPKPKTVLEPKKDFDSTGIKFVDLQEPGSDETVVDNGGVDEPIKRKRGRPRKAEQQAESQEQVLKITEDIFTPVFKLLNKILIQKYSPVVKLDDDEIMSLKFYLALVANKYLPSVIQKFGAEVTLGMIALTITADKTIKYQEWKQGNEKLKIKNEKLKKEELENLPN